MATAPVRDVRDALRAGLDPEPDAVASPGERLAAVMALLVQRPSPSLVFTVRAGGLSRHAGEVSFPGGIVDPGETAIGGALREAHEEIGLDPALPEVIGALPPVHTTVSGILVVPFVAVVAELPMFQVSGAEIDQLVVLPVADLAAAEAEVLYELPEGGTWRGWVYETGGITVWGATGRMVHDLLDVMRREAPWLTLP
jgi:8-oxo-dGTP pyrophosphatase MutT (NUDIX family)